MSSGSHLHSSTIKNQLRYTWYMYIYFLNWMRIFIFYLFRKIRKAKPVRRQEDLFSGDLPIVDTRANLTFYQLYIFWPVRYLFGESQLHPALMPEQAMWFTISGHAVYTAANLPKLEQQFILDSRLLFQEQSALMFWAFLCLRFPRWV